MKILHLSPYYPPAWAFGPTPASIAALARAQAELGHRVTVLTTNAMAPHERLYADDSVIDGVRVVRVRNVSGATRTWLGCSTPIGMRRTAARLLAERTDVLHLHELVTTEALRVVPIASSHVTMVASLHGQLSEPGRLTPFMARLWRTCGGPRLSSRLRIVAAATQEEADTARATAPALGAALARTQVVAQGVDLGEWDPPVAAASTRAALGLAEDAVAMLVAGRAPGAGALASIVEAFATLAREQPRVQLAIAGPDEPAVRAAREQMHALGLDKRMRLCGYLAPVRLRQALAVCCALALPAGHPEAEGMVVDALARGIPVIVQGTHSTLRSDAIVSVADTRDEWLRGMRTVLDGGAAAGLRAAATAAVAPLGWRARATEWLAMYDMCRPQPTRD